ncbi:MAG: hypothetical protein JWL63_908 [Rhodocyclales bacterium]|nr:hypothetical protein [Rhodocyclales bacterium]
MRPCNNRFVAIVLAMFVLLAQYGANLHVLSHAVQDVADSSKRSGTAPDQRSPSGHENCEQCLSFAAAGAGAALPGTPYFSLHAFGHVTGAPLRATHLLRRTTAAYHSRAPPPSFV